MKKLFAVFGILLCSNVLALCNNWDFEQNGIYYKVVSIADRTVSVATNDPTNGGCYSGDIVIPEEVVYNGKSLNVTILDFSAFKNCKELNSIVIPNTITKIYNWCFDGCSNLKDVIFKDGDTPCYVGRGQIEYRNGSTEACSMFHDCMLDSVYMGRNITYEITK